MFNDNHNNYNYNHNSDYYKRLTKVGHTPTTAKECVHQERGYVWPSPRMKFSPYERAVYTANKNNIKRVQNGNSCTPVSYTHLDVYKRQYIFKHFLLQSIKYTEVTYFLGS